MRVTVRNGDAQALSYNSGMRENETSPRHRPVRSYVVRGGRLTPGQQRAIDKLYPRLGVPEGSDGLNFEKLFGRAAPTVLEIGFGNGESTWRMASAEPDKNFLGIEVHPPGVGRLLMALDENDVGNVRVCLGDAVVFLKERIADHSLAGIRIYFPDPWHKKRHNKRRLIQPDFVALLAQKMAPSGVLHLATDWVPYAEHMLEVLQASAGFKNLSPDGDFVEQPAWRPGTKYEARGERLGHETRDLLFQRRTP